MYVHLLHTAIYIRVVPENCKPRSEVSDWARDGNPLALVCVAKSHGWALYLLRRLLTGWQITGACFPTRR